MQTDRWAYKEADIVTYGQTELKWIFKQKILYCISKITENKTKWLRVVVCTFELQFCEPHLALRLINLWKLLMY